MLLAQERVTRSVLCGIQRGMRKLTNTLVSVTESPWFTRFIVAVIVINAATLTLEAIPVTQQPWKDVLYMVDRAALLIFWMEAVLKISAKRAGYFKEGWNLFDFTILLLTSAPGIGNLSALRSLRILRALRLFSVVPQFRFVAEAFIASIRTVLATMAIISVVTLIASVMAVGLLGAKHPEYFGTLDRAVFSMLQLMTLENWPTILLPVFRGATVPEVILYAVFFGSHFVVSTVALFNLLIAAVLKGIERPTALDDDDVERIAEAVVARLRSQDGH